MRQPCFAAFVLLSVLLAGGCGPIGLTVDRDLLREITVENKLLLFDAENDVSIAIDEREQIHRQIYQAKADIRDTEAQIEEAISDQDRALEKGDERNAELAAMAHDVYLLEADYLEERLEFLRDKLKAQEDMILVALAKFELAKAKLVKKNNVRGAQDIELADFEEQVDRYVEDATDTRVDLEEREKEVEAVKQEWLKTRDELMAKSGGGVGSPWAEDSALWGATY